MDRTIIEKYEKAADSLQMAIRGLQREDLLAFPVPGTWSIQQIVMHVVDSDLIMTHRMKRVIAEDNPPLLAFDEKRFAGALFYDQQSADDAAALFQLNRRNFSKVLHKLPAEAFERAGVHSERGRLTLSNLLVFASDHVAHHLKFLVDKREKLGKMMW